jgi:hypothetical protein
VSFSVEALEETILKYGKPEFKSHWMAGAVYLHEITDGFQAKWVIDTWIRFYNSERPHTALDKRTPDIAYFGQVETRKAAWTETRCILDKPKNCPKK